jgi:hypothetical protein
VVAQLLDHRPVAAEQAPDPLGIEADQLAEDQHLALVVVELAERLEQRHRLVWHHRHGLAARRGRLPPADRRPGERDHAHLQTGGVGALEDLVPAVHGGAEHLGGQVQRARPIERPAEDVPVDLLGMVIEQLAREFMAVAHSRRSPLLVHFGADLTPCQK